MAGHDSGVVYKQKIVRVLQAVVRGDREQRQGSNRVDEEARSSVDSLARGIF